MPHLIIGHSTDTTTRIWVRGDSKSRTCKVGLRTLAGEKSQTLELLPEHDYTGTTDFTDLEPGAEYLVLANFSPLSASVHGRVRMMNSVLPELAESFSFVLSSCNLSVVSINNFLALLAATAGTALATSSLDRPVERWKAPRLMWLRLPLRWLLRKGLRGIAWAVIWSTGIKQPGTPYIRSPFLKLSAVFDSWLVEVHPSPVPPPVRSDDVDDVEEVPFLAVGERVKSSSGATGVIASAQVVQQPEVQQTAGAGRPLTDKKPALPVRHLVLTQVEGAFKTGEALSRQLTSNSGYTLSPLGTIGPVAPARPWYGRPSFFLHAGDQIYYDFPAPDRAPSRDEDRLAYREAWFEDDSLCHVLAHWPHYMTLDDHEIADQFANDFEVPIKKPIKNRKVDPTDYLREARVAYDEYTHALISALAGGRSTGKDGSYWYTFDKGNTHFFVLDTRTSRRNRGTPAIIDEEQMLRLLDWLMEHRHDLKFVVTSVPFVAQINERASNRKNDWWKDKASSPVAEASKRVQPPASGPSTEDRNSEHDKWSATRFERQRDRIIEYIAANGIERLVFLTGDMHCCYHATMRIGPRARKYESITVHELAGGPVNQLQLANVNEFDRRCAKTTKGDRRVDYEVILERFHGEVSAVMHIRVVWTQRDEVTSADRALVPEVEWNVIRTLTDPGPAAWSEQPKPLTVDPLADAETSSGESVMAGRISFVRRRDPEGLHPWSTTAVADSEAHR